MEIIRTLRIARREWGNIRSSLEACGDIGEFDSENPINSRLTEIEGSHLVKNLIDMDNKFETHGYFTQEAAYVFSALVSSAAERLGLVGGLADTFANGYSWVRTGWFDIEHVGKQHVIKQLFFMKIFFHWEGISTGILVHVNQRQNSRPSLIYLLGGRITRRAIPRTL